MALKGQRARRKRRVAFRDVPVGGCFIYTASVFRRGEAHRTSTWVYRKTSRLTAASVTGESDRETRVPPHRHVKIRACRPSRRY